MLIKISNLREFSSFDFQFGQNCSEEEKKEMVNKPED